MTNRHLTMASIAIVILLLLAGCWTALSLPGDMALPTHWDAQGRPDQFSSKWVALLVPAIGTAMATLFFLALPRIEPRAGGLERSRGLYVWGWVSMLMAGATVQAIVILGALGRDVPVLHVFATVLGLSLCLAGNQMGKSRSMYLIGIRTPWTLVDEDVWNKTHRLAGKFLVASGLVLIVAGVMRVPADILTGLLLATLVLGLLVPSAYSYALWKRKNRDTAG